VGVYIARRLGWAVVVLVAVASLTFALTFVAPGDPARAIAGPKANLAFVEQVRAELGLDRPPIEQLAAYFGRLITGDLGYSYEKRAPVLSLVAGRLLPTIELAIAALAISMLIGVPLGVAAARRPGGWADRIARIGAALVLALPAFLIGYLLIYALAFRPQADLGISLLPIPGANPRWDPLDLRALFLPALTLALAGVAFYARLTRTVVLDELHHGYVLTARSKGLDERGIVWRHVLRNAMGPILSQAGLDLGFFLGGVVVIEIVFGWPGIGKLAYDAINSEDLSLLMGTVLIATLFIVLANLVVDIIQAFIDPRVRLV